MITRQSNEIHTIEINVLVVIRIEIDSDKKDILLKENEFQIVHKEGEMNNIFFQGKKLIYEIKKLSRFNTQSLDRKSHNRGQSQRSARAHSMARCENHYSSQRIVPEVNVRDYTMTLPASRGRHRSRIIGM